MFNSIRDIAMFMLYLVLAFLLLNNFTGFTAILSTVGDQWRRTLAVLQGQP